MCETAEDRKRKLDELLKQIQQQQTAAQMPASACPGCLAPGQAPHQSGCPAVQPSSAMPPWGNWPNVLVPVGAIPDKITPDTEVRIVGADFGAQVFDQIALARQIDGGKGEDRMRVPSFEEREMERARMAEHFRTRGIL